MSGFVTIAPLSNRGVSVIDFGATPVDTGNVVVSGQVGIQTTAQARAWIQGAGIGTIGGDQMLAGQMLTFTASNITADVGFTIRAVSNMGIWNGTLTVEWEWKNAS